MTQADGMKAYVATHLTEEEFLRCRMEQEAELVKIINEHKATCPGLTARAN